MARKAKRGTPKHLELLSPELEAVFDTPNPYAALGEILAHKHLGPICAHLVGEVIIAQTRLGRWISWEGQKFLSADEWVEAVKQHLDCEDHYKAAWNELNALNVPNQQNGQAQLWNEKAQRLQAALQQAVTTFSTMHEKLVNKP